MCTIIVCGCVVLISLHEKIYKRKTEHEHGMLQLYENIRHLDSQRA